MKDIVDQSQLIAQYNKEYVQKFNPELFKRDDELILQSIKDIILSCERKMPNFIFQVYSMEIIDDYGEINNILYNYEESLIKGKNKKRLNPYKFINVKETAMRLLKVVYYVKIKDEEKYVTKYVAIPRVVNKYFFKIYGTSYSIMYQISDGSTFNSLTSKKAKSESVTFKSILLSAGIYRKHGVINDFYGNEVNITQFSILCFSRIYNIWNVFLAKYGLYGALAFSKLQYITIARKEPPKTDDKYVFMNNNIFIYVPKDIFDADEITQSFIYAILFSIGNHTKYESLFENDHWLKILGGEYGINTPDKGRSILMSLEGNYDIPTKKDLRLPDDVKETIYGVFLWMMREYQYLSKKDNLDVSTKKCMYHEVIAALYGMKEAFIVRKLTDLQFKKKLTMKAFEKAMRGINPYYLLDQMTKCQLVNYKDNVNDMDSINAIKYTYKRLPGLEKASRIKAQKSSSMSDDYKYIHYSQLGRMDLDSSSKSDPGITGILCPLTDIYNFSFSDYEEPLTWEDNFCKLIDNYNDVKGLTQIMKARKQLLNDNTMDESLQFAAYSLDIFDKLFKPVYAVEYSRENEPDMIPLEKGGYINYVRY